MSFLRVVAASLAVTLISSLPLLSPPEASSVTGCANPVEIAETVSVQGAFQTVIRLECHGGKTTPTSGKGPKGLTSPIGDGLCLLSANLAGVDPETYCGSPAAQTEPALTPSVVRNALKRLDLPRSKLEVQPPNGRTLVNFDTNFYTERTPFTRAVTLLGRRVELRIEPVRFTWHFGDGAPRTTASPGAPYPDLDVTHDYARAGRYAPRVDTTYGADWRVAGGAWQRVPGTVTITGDAVALEATEARPTLVR